MKDKIHIKSFNEATENLNSETLDKSSSISDVRSSKINEKIVVEGTEKFNSVEKLHKFLTYLIEEGKGDFEIQIDNADYTYEYIEEVRIYDDVKRIILY
jgi:hypothetical protein